MEERRKSGRVPLHLPASWGRSSRMQRAVVLNGSEGGCFVQAQVDDPGDDPLRLVIQLPHGESLQLWAEVAYHLPTVGFGLQFVEPTDGGERMLERWAEYLRVAEREGH